jgi:hypothetical protein
MKRKLQQEKKENFLSKKVKLSDSIYGTLPNEILQNIFSYLLPTTTSEMKFFTDLSLVSKSWYQYFNNEEEEENETSSKMFWLEFYKKYFDLEEDLFKEEIKTLTTTDIKEIFFERYQQENVKDSVYVDVPISADYVTSMIDSLDENTISELILLFKSKNSLIITGVGYQSEDITIDKTEYEYGMKPKKLTMSLTGTLFLRNSFSIDFNVHHDVTHYYENDGPTDSNFELEINEKKIVEFLDEIVVHSTLIEEICDSIEVENHKCFFILLMVTLFYLIEEETSLSKIWKGFGKFRIMYHIFDIIENMNLLDEDESE